MGRGITTCTYRKVVMKKHKTGFLFALYERGQCTRKKPVDPHHLWTEKTSDL